MCIKYGEGVIRDEIEVKGKREVIENLYILILFLKGKKQEFIEDFLKKDLYDYILFQKEMGMGSIGFE